MPQGLCTCWSSFWNALPLSCSCWLSHVSAQKSPSHWSLSWPPFSKSQFTPPISVFHSPFHTFFFYLALISLRTLYLSLIYLVHYLCLTTECKLHKSGNFYLFNSWIKRGSLLQSLAWCMHSIHSCWIRINTKNVVFSTPTVNHKLKAKYN